jgi:serine/threonine-protein kinase HipA
VRRCPLTYEEVEGRYNLTALRRLDSRLTDLADLPLTSEQLRVEARQQAVKISIQGVQPKLSAILSVKHQRFELVSRGARFILKPQHPDFPSVPENEDLTMNLARSAGIDVPVHGLIYGADGQLTYWIKRFDRVGKNQRLATEDFGQLLSEPRETKYTGSLEKVAQVVSSHCTFPVLQRERLLRLVLFSFICGNEDQHLKNFSLLTTSEGQVQLSPAYDLLNSAILLRDPEETALPLRGKKRRLKRADFLDYYAGDRLQLRAQVVERMLQEFQLALPDWPRLIRRSFLPADQQIKYEELLLERTARLELKLYDSTDETFPVLLSNNELEPLERPVSGSGGMQSLLRSLQRLRNGRIQSLTPELAEAVARRAYWSQGGFQGRLQPLAQRLLADGLVSQEVAHRND